jgi:hypothetical protein
MIGRRKIKKNNMLAAVPQAFAKRLSFKMTHQETPVTAATTTWNKTVTNKKCRVKSVWG